MRRSAILLLLFLTAVVFGCSSPDHTMDTLRKQIADYKAAPDDTKQAAIEASFAKLDEQIIALEKQGDTVRSEHYRKQEDSLNEDFQLAKIARVVKDARSTLQGLGNSVKKMGENLGDVFKDANTAPNASTNR